MENLVRKLISRTIPEAERDDFYAELDGDVERDKRGTLRTSGGNRIEYDADGQRTEFDEDGTAVATSAEGSDLGGDGGGTVIDTPKEPREYDPAESRTIADTTDDERAARSQPADSVDDARRVADDDEDGDGFVDADPYDTWSKSELQDECDARGIDYAQKDTVATLASKLEEHDAGEGA